MGLTSLSPNCNLSSRCAALQAVAKVSSFVVHRWRWRPARPIPLYSPTTFSLSCCLQMENSCVSHGWRQDDVRCLCCTFRLLVAGSSDVTGGMQVRVYPRGEHRYSNVDSLKFGGVTDIDVLVQTSTRARCPQRTAFLQLPQPAMVSAPMWS